MPASPTRTSRQTRSDLRKLARACGIQLSFKSSLVGTASASDESLLLAVRAWGVDIESASEAGGALGELMAQRAARRVEPVTVAWVGRKSAALLRLPTKRDGTPKVTGTVRCAIAWETGGVSEWGERVDALKTIARRQPDGSMAHFAKMDLAQGGRAIEAGYHRLRVEHGGEVFESLLIAAPVVSYQPGGEDENPKELGLFCPTYAIRSGDNLGIGNLTDLRRLAAWGGRHGADLISTLPLLSNFLDDSELFDPSPYSPVSRLFWNELFVDVRTTAEFASCDKARRVYASAAFIDEAKRLRRRRGLVDYRASSDLQRSVLEPLAKHFFRHGGDRSPAYRALLADNPQLKRYAKFRAACERQGTNWTEWPKAMRNGRLGVLSGDPAVERYHLYAQYATTRQLELLKDDFEQRGGKFYLDLAVGSSPDGFDVWANRGLFMTGSSVGSPPDGGFVNGQDWGFPPMHPQRAREEGYGYFIDSLQTQMKYATHLRLDHVMALNRLFLIPDGHTAHDGVYQEYHDDEMFAILSLESHRNRCRVIGENLGTVPKAIETGMTKHRVGKLWVGQNAIRPDAKRAMGEPIEPNCAASLNTHDAAPFALHFDGDDIPLRVKLGVFNPENEKKDRKWRRGLRQPLVRFLRAEGLLSGRGKPEPEAIAEAIYRFIAQSAGEVALVNIEDLWGERRCQNVPGTTDEHANWRHKLARTIEQIEKSEDLGAFVEELGGLRESG